MKCFVSAAVAICALVFAASAALAQDVDRVSLTIDGRIADKAERDFSIKDLEALGTTTIVTSTPWHDGKVRFEGVPLETLMKHVGASGEKAAVLALNNYRTEIPLSDFADYPVILATKKNGDYMPVTDKGPLFVIYPFDTHTELKNELFYSRSAWQVRKITIE